MAYRTVGRSRYRKSRSSRRSRGRSTLWVRHQEVTPVGVLANYGVNIFPAAELDPGARAGATVVRCLGVFELLGAALTSATGGLFIGLAVTNISNFGTNTTPPILPFADRNGVNWMHWRYVPVSSLAVGKWANPPGTPTTISMSYEFDSKSSRVMNSPHESCVFVVQNNGISGTTGANFVFSTLIKLA